MSNTPTSEQNLSDLIQAAEGPIRILGGGTRDIGAPVDGTLVSTAGLSGVTLYEPGALTLVAQSGTPLEEISTLLVKEGQRLSFEPSDLRGLLGTSGASTIGGVVATNASGPRRVQVGAARDFCLGVRFVDGAGRVLKNGGRVMKNVTGYDLVKLMAGSWGTLGVMTEVSLKVMAIPETETTLVGEGQTATQAVESLSAALGSPFDVTGAAFAEGKTFVRIEGLEASVSYRTAELANGVLAGFQPVSGAASSDIWARIRDVSSFADRDGAVWRISVKPSDGPRLVATLEDLAPDAIYDWGGGLVWLHVADQADAGAARVRAELAKLGGHATLVRAPAEVRAAIPVFQPEPAPIAALTRGLRQKFDPRGILNPGLMGA
ncbi:putative FAD-linked oxidoreductase [Aliiroseovarius pelagivivens]|uniref:Putative FAD-linked oxidoreductase n=1 Tax=Aliiroseovarius pelagivivens TaxID=1639690 RepID=A0A2R8AM47_9RHOB|nr:glycolate oxidase subunit GlcE [Aliiroseovarius pelagivivens]SPF77080.1 putative FAD-linked oxidoreductase [Aliiroseovarius pelagivivens]